MDVSRMSTRGVPTRGMLAARKMIPAIIKMVGLPPFAAEVPALT